MGSRTNDGPEGTYVGRLAPSPTGLMHMGIARTFLAAWLDARANAGRLLLRIEDVDTGRARPGCDAQLMEDLQWLGLDWDEGPGRPGPAAPYYQSERFRHYSNVIPRAKLDWGGVRDLLDAEPCIVAALRANASLRRIFHRVLKGRAEASCASMPENRTQP